MSGSTSGGTVVGSGSDTIVLNVSEDQALGVDAQFTVKVDGKQIGGLQTATASHAAGQDETFTFRGNYDVGPHDVTVTFANNFILPGQRGSIADGADRNVYVDKITYNGQSLGSAAIYESPLYPPEATDGVHPGNAVFPVYDTTPVPADAPSTPTTTPGAVSVGSGADTLALNMAEDAYQGDAQFTVSVDGQQVGGLQTVTASVAQGQQQEFDVHGNWGSGGHTVSVAFTNDKIGEFYPGTDLAVDTTDRNLYVLGMKLNGGPASSDAPWEQASNGSHSFSVTAGSGAPTATAATVATAPTPQPGTSDAGSASGTGTTGDNATITASSLSANPAQTGSSSAMSFMASPTDSGTSASTTSSGGAGSDSSSTGPTSGMTPTAASSISGATQGTQDWNMPSATAASDTNATSGTNGNGGNWWMSHQVANAGGVMAYHEG